MSAAGVCRLMFWAGKMEEIGELIMNGQEALRLSRRFEPLHDLPRRFVTSIPQRFSAEKRVTRDNTALAAS
ncbi:MAG: hypothetical protein WBO09_14090 [Methylocystis silviterrae]